MVCFYVGIVVVFRLLILSLILKFCCFKGLVVFRVFFLFWLFGSCSVVVLGGFLFMRVFFLNL